MSTLKALPRSKIRGQAAEQIKVLIDSEQLIPGDRLPTESELAKTLGISRLSVREATRALEYLGIVEVKTGVGLTVGSQTADVDRLRHRVSSHAAGVELVNASGGLWRSVARFLSEISRERK